MFFFPNPNWMSTSIPRTDRVWPLSISCAKVSYVLWLCDSLPFQSDILWVSVGVGGAWSSPLVVSLSLTRNVPLLFSKLSSSLSESRRVILPKYHLIWSNREGTGRSGLVRAQRVEAKDEKKQTHMHTQCHDNSCLPGLCSQCEMTAEEGRQKVR